jgi:putative transcriptional regulator
MRKPKSEIAEAVHETATDLYQVGLIDRVRMWEFDRLCLQPIEPLEPESINPHSALQFFAHQGSTIEPCC